MTPEQRAEAVLEAWYFGRHHYASPDDCNRRLARLIAAAVRNAVAEERERCARIAEAGSRAYDEDLGREIAAEIRAGGQT